MSQLQEFQLDDKERSIADCLSFNLTSFCFQNIAKVFSNQKNIHFYEFLYTRLSIMIMDESVKMGNEHILEICKKPPNTKTQTISCHSTL